MSPSQQSELFRESPVHDEIDMRLTKFSFGIARHKKIDSSKLGLHKDSIKNGSFIVEDAPLDMLEDKLSTVDHKGSKNLEFKSDRKLDFKAKFS